MFYVKSLPMVFCFNAIVSAIVLVAFVVVFPKLGPFTTNGYCNAFSAVEESIVRARHSSSLIRAPVIRNFRPRSFSVSHMTSSDENDEKLATIVKDRYDGAQSLLTTVDGADEKKTPPFDEAVWKAYEAVIEEIMRQKRVIKKCDDEMISRCRTFLLSNEQHLSAVPDVMEIVGKADDGQKEALRSSLRQQAEEFRHFFNVSNDEVEFINRCLVYMGDACAKIQSKKKRKNENHFDDSHNDIDPRLPIAVAWYKLKEMGYVIRENSMSTYMYILSNSGEGDHENNAFVDDALMEVVTCHNTIYKPSEKTVTILLKSLIARGKIDEAEEMFTSSFDGGGRISSPSNNSTTEETEKRNNKENTGGRLRTYMPLMEHYCMNGNLTSTLRLYRQMQDCTGVHWDVESYSLLLSSLARFGYFFGDNNEHVNENNFSGDDDTNFNGPILFDTLVSNMANDILELTEKISVQLTDAFHVGIKDYLDNKLIIDKNNEIDELPFDIMEVERVEIPKGNGTCPITGVKLRLLALDELQRQHVHDTLLEMSRTTTEEFISSMKARQQKPKKNYKKRKLKIRETINGVEANLETYGYQELLKFSRWLDDREGDLFTTIVDGANVAYYGHSNVHYSSLKKVVEKLESMGERPLVIMPEKYTLKSFACRPNFYQKLTQKDQEVIDWLRENEMMYTVPRLNLDDYFWMLASVSNQTNANKRGDLSIPVGDDQGRFPGMRPMLITNDQMRDHKLELLEPREFRRWSSCHIVNYDIAFYEKDEWEEDRQISFVPADSFSREIQSNLHKNGNDTVWHFPICDSADWLCISIKR